MTRLANIWHDITEGHSLTTLWQDFRREARSSFEGSAPQLADRSSGLKGWRRYWFFARAMFFRLTPARRILVLLGLVFFFAGLDSSGQPGPDAHGLLIAAALCLLSVLALEVADRVAMKRDLEVARDIQNWLVPNTPPSIPGLDVAFASRPANTVAGDYYDILALPPAGASGPSVLFVVADVAGKGIPAGLLMACFRSCLHTLAGTTCDLADLALRLNRPCFADSFGGRHFTTAFFAQYWSCSHSISYINAGHNPALLRSNSGEVTSLMTGGLPCGAFPNALYETGTAPLRQGDLLLIYTDGIVEAVNESGHEYGIDRLTEFLRASEGASESLRQGLFHSLEDFTGHTPQRDDMTCMIIQCTA